MDGDRHLGLLFEYKCHFNMFYRQLDVLDIPIAYVEWDYEVKLENK